MENKSFLNSTAETVSWSVLWLKDPHVLFLLYLSHLTKSRETIAENLLFKDQDQLKF